MSYPEGLHLFSIGSHTDVRFHRRGTKISYIVARAEERLAKARRSKLSFVAQAQDLDTHANLGNRIKDSQSWFELK